MPFFYWKNEKVEYFILRRNRKTIGITIDVNGKIEVLAPYYVGDEYIDNVIKEKSGWIIKKLNNAAEMNRNFKKLEFENGEKLLYLGCEYVLKVELVKEENGYVRLFKDFICVTINYRHDGENRKQIIKELLLNWYKIQAVKVLGERTNTYSEKLKLYHQKISVRAQKRIWGSCSGKNAISYNYRLVMAPLDVLDYVIVHELCHIKYKNHSKTYWDMVESFVPDYKGKKKWLKENILMLEALD